MLLRFHLMKLIYNISIYNINLQVLQSKSETYSVLFFEVPHRVNDPLYCEILKHLEGFPK